MGCGICGFVGLSDKELLHSMCDSIRHRGPDDTRYFIDDGVGLGIDRLSIIDLVTGSQPIHNEDQSVWVILNGEVYNYVELRSELESRGHSFYTESDTETIVHAYEEWGDDCPSHLNGMFAFAIWDSPKKRLYLARDRFGKKPLFYALVDNVLLFGSELKTILQYGGIRKHLNYQAIDQFFAFMYIPSPLTIFSSIHKLPPAHYATYEKGEFTARQYWDIEWNPDDHIDEDSIIERLYETLQLAVRRRLRSDVPLGAFLSGGIDSSSVVALMAKLSKIPVKTVSIGFDDALSEVKYSRQVAEYLGSDHQEYIVEPKAYEILPKLIWHFDEPFADHSMIPTYYLSEVTRRNVTVALSGDGGDEMFMGYPFLTDPPVFGLYSRIPSPVRMAALRTIMGFPVKGTLTRMAQHAYEKDYGGQSPYERYLMRITLFDQRGLSKFYSQEFLDQRAPSDISSYVFGSLNNCKKADTLSAIDYATIKNYLEEDILTKVDRMSMAVSLEVRCPLLDQDLVRLVEKIPSRLKLNGKFTKFIFKKMVVRKQLIPPEIALRKKQGFGAPVHNWIRKEWKEITAQLLDPVIMNNYTGLFNKDYVKKMLRDPYLNSNRLFTLVVFLLWYRMFVENEAILAPPAKMSTVA